MNVTPRTSYGRGPLFMFVCVLALSVCASASPFYIVEVTAPDEVALADLLNCGLTIDNRVDRKVTFYVNEEELEQLKKLSYPLHLLETIPDGSSAEKASGYTSYDQIGPLFSSYANQYPNIVQTGTLGQTPQYREIWAIKITLTPEQEADKPVVKYIAAIHGDEIVGVEMCLYFIQDLLENFGKNPFISDLIRKTVIWVVPIMNPDGHAAVSRYSAGKDLNRNFPAYGQHYSTTLFDGEPLGDEKVPVENGCIMRWHVRYPANLCANFHGGALLANYPYDNTPGISSGSPAISPDDDVFRYLALEYSRNNPPMYQSPIFPQGIINGSAWYSITGGMMDWHYRFLGCPELTLEISADKRPPASQLPRFWDENRDAMYAYLSAVHMGIRGLVKDRTTKLPLWAKVMTHDRAQPVFTSRAVGNYHRLLLPGTYNLTYQAPGYITYHADAIAVESSGTTRKDIFLSDGDVNQDGTKDAEDVQAVVNAALGKATSFDADVDGRGLSATDIQAVINAVL
mgnify:FL=1